MSFKKSYIIDSILVAFLIVLIALSSYVSSGVTTENALPQVAKNWIHPPMLMYNNYLYTSTRIDGRKLVSDDLILMGLVESTTSFYETPYENFQTNYDYLGSEIYESSNWSGYLFIKYEESYIPFIHPSTLESLLASL